MTMTIKDVDFQVELPDIPRFAPVVAHALPCLRDRAGTTKALSEILDIDVKGTAQVPHGYIHGSDRGQVEVFAASGAIRARNAQRLSAFKDEHREWRDIERDEDGAFRLGVETAKLVGHQGLELLQRIGIQEDFAHLDVSLGQWARLDERGIEEESGPGRATVRLSYAAHGLPLIGAGAKTNLHFDPVDGGRGVALARMFHVLRGVESEGEVATQSLDEAFAGLLSQSWSGHGIREGEGRMTITGATFGLLALPADIVQSFAAPALRVEGSVTGVEVGRDETVTVRFGQYVSLAHPRALAGAGFGAAQLTPGTVVRGRSQGQ